MSPYLSFSCYKIFHQWGNWTSTCNFYTPNHFIKSILICFHIRTLLMTPTLIMGNSYIRKISFLNLMNPTFSHESYPAKEFSVLVSILMMYDCIGLLYRQEQSACYVSICCCIFRTVSDFIRVILQFNNWRFVRN